MQRPTGPALSRHAHGVRGEPESPFGEGAPDWGGQKVVIVGAGPSAQSEGLEVARYRARVLTINESWRLCPWADALYACDGVWWEVNQGVPEFAGLKITQDRWAAGKYGALRFETKRREDRLVLSPKGFIGWGGNSGFQALNIAVQLGASRVVLVGFDLNLDGGLHWHGAHRGRLHNPTAESLQRWAKILDDQAPLLAAQGVEVVNASARSALTAYPKIPLKDALAC